MREVYSNKTTLIKNLIKPTDVVLDVGFWGQGVSHTRGNWVHKILTEHAKDVYGLDLEYDESALLKPADHYRKESAENFSFNGLKFDVIFAGDLIEHLSNPGLFLDSVKRHLAPEGRLIVTTPNCFNLFNLTEKMSKGEPTVNPDHTCYFNDKTLRQLFAKNGYNNVEFAYVYSLDLMHKESIKKKMLNVLYKLLSFMTPKYIETIVVIARPVART